MMYRFFHAVIWKCERANDVVATILVTLAMLLCMVEVAR